jgi:hypothetical protein
VIGEATQERLYYARRKGNTLADLRSRTAACLKNSQGDVDSRPAKLSWPLTLGVFSESGN